MESPPVWVEPTKGEQLKIVVVKNEQASAETALSNGKEALLHQLKVSSTWTLLTIGSQLVKRISFCFSDIFLINCLRYYLRGFGLSPLTSTS